MSEHRLPHDRHSVRLARSMASDAVADSLQPTERDSFFLLVSELVSNAISHGFEGKKRGTISIRAWSDNGNATVEVANDGHGVPEELVPAESEGLGMRIVHRLVTSDLRGAFTIKSDDRLTVATITFPLDGSDRGGSLETGGTSVAL